VRSLLEISDIGNGFFQFAQPWAVMKTDPAEAQRITSSACELVKRLAILYTPILPVLCGRVLETLNVHGASFADLEKPLVEGTLGSSLPLLARVQDLDLAPPHPFSLLNLKVARIVEAVPHPKADKLLKLKVDLGTETRQVVAGIRACYAPEALVGKIIIVVANLKPAVLRGEESRGMLLAASEGEKIAVLTVKADPGTPISCGDIVAQNPQEIPMDTFLTVPLEARDGMAFHDGKYLTADGAPVLTDVPVTGKIK
jgi:methionyl-tRNA synthetase